MVSPVGTSARAPGINLLPNPIATVVFHYSPTQIYKPEFASSILPNDIAAQVAAYVNYITPVEGAKEAAVAIDPDLADNNLIFPDAATLKNAHIFRTLTPAQEQSYGAAFQSVLLGA